jgi:hypothetical protein
MTKTRWMLTAVVASIASSVVAIAICLCPQTPHAKTDRLIAEYRGDSSPASAARLAEAISYGYASQEQGAQIVRLLLKPRPELSGAYPCDKQIHFKMRQPFQVWLPWPSPLFTSSERFEPPEAPRLVIYGDYTPLANIERSFEWGVPPYPVGVQHVVAKYRCSWPYWPRSWETTRDKLIRWLGRGPADKPMTYEASWEVPFDINVVAPEQATSGPASRPAAQTTPTSRPGPRGVAGSQSIPQLGIRHLFDMQGEASVPCSLGVPYH